MGAKISLVCLRELTLYREPNQFCFLYVHSVIDEVKICYGLTTLLILL